MQIKWEIMKTETNHDRKIAMKAKDNVKIFQKKLKKNKKLNYSWSSKK